MKKILMWVFMLFVILLSGCTEDDMDKNVIIVAGLHNNAPAISYTYFEDDIKNVCLSGGRVVLINTLGETSKLVDTEIPETDKNLPSVKIQDIANDYTNKVMNMLRTSNSIGEENNTLNALNLAARSVQNQEDQIIVLDTGLQTVSPLNFCDGWLNSVETPSEIADNLADSIPDFKGATIHWYYLGDVREPQEPLSGSDRKRLEEIWSCILDKANCSYIFEDAVPPSESFTTLGYVTPVELNKNEILPEIHVIETVVLDESKVNFIGNQDVFVDKNAAIDALIVVADELKNNPDNTVYVVGTTATGKNLDFCQNLSVARAQAVVNVLIDLGVDEKQLIPLGFGFYDPWHIPDLDEQGLQVEEKAKLNRKTLIIDTQSEDALKLQGVSK